MAGLLSTAVSGLQVSQTALKTSGHNIANANTPGYSRQRIEVATNIANLTGAGYIGNGATVTSVDRIVDEFLISQLRSDTSLHSELQSGYENIRQLDTLLSDPSTGLSQGLDRFFSVMENGADDPTSIPSRQLIISEAENLATRFNTLYERVENVNESVHQKMSAAIGSVNALAENIAEINTKIAQAGSGTSQPNDLLDQREEALRELAKLIKIDIVDQGDGLLNVSFGSGQSLVVGGNARTLALVDGELEPSQKDIAYVDRSGSQIITRFVSGGELGGLLDFRESTLSNAFNELGRVAMVLADSFNEVHSRGVDLNNQFGGLFFADVNDPATAARRVQGDSDNAPPRDRLMSVELLDGNQLTSSDYSLEVASGGNSYRVTRISDGTVVYNGGLPGSYPQSVEFDGLRLNFISGSFQSGDKFLIQPTRTGARDFASALQRPDQIAFASPLATDADIGNTGNGTIDPGSLVALKNASGIDLPLFAKEGEMSPPLLVYFTSATTYDILDNSDPGNPVQLDPPIRNRTYMPGQENQLFSSDPGETLITAQGAAPGIGAKVTGASPLAAVPNGYPSEVYYFQYTDPGTGNMSQQVVNTVPDSSARTIAAQFSDVKGVTAYARNAMTLSGMDGLSLSAPLQINLNGTDLLPYNAGVLAVSVPDPGADPAAFNRFLAERINSDASFSDLGISAVSGTNAVTGQPELRIVSTRGDDFNITLEAANAASESLTVTDYNGDSSILNGGGAGTQESVTVGGTIDMVLASDYKLVTNPVLSSLFGDSSAAGFAQSSYLGIAASINGVPDAGDRFTLDFNSDGVFDNRNAIELVNLNSAGLIDGGNRTISDGYSSLVETIGISTNAAEINLQASEKVLTQTEDMRNSISGVNLDEEAANLIQFEQIYNANAQVISIARDLFDRLISTF